MDKFCAIHDSLKYSVLKVTFLTCEVGTSNLRFPAYLLVSEVRSDITDLTFSTSVLDLLMYLFD